MNDAPPQVPYAVTGSTGEIGGRVAARLAAAGVPQRLVVREPGRAPELSGSHAVGATYGDAEAMRRAFEGAQTAFLVSAAEAVDRVQQHLTAVEAARAAGVERIVYLSFLNAAPDATFTLTRHHWLTEQAIRATELPFTFLRDSVYADFVPFMTSATDLTIRGPAGDGRASFVARDDIGEVAATVLLDGDGRHDGMTYDVTGPAAITLTEAAAITSRALGREVSYHVETLDEAYESRSGYGAPDWEVTGWVTSYTAIAAGELSTVTDAVERVTGHPAISLAELYERHPDLLDGLRDG